MFSKSVILIYLTLFIFKLKAQIKVYEHQVDEYNEKSKYFSPQEEQSLEHCILEECTGKHVDPDKEPRHGCINFDLDQFKVRYSLYTISQANKLVYLTSRIANQNLRIYFAYCN